MAAIIDTLSWVCLLGGAAFSIVGAVGLIRLPDAFARIHGASLIDTMGLTLILLGLGLQAGFGMVAIKLFMIFVFVFFTSPTATHALASAALEEGLNPLLGDGKTRKQEQDPSKS